MSEEVYHPSWKNLNKYFIYLDYFWEYVKHNDFKSLKASLRYVLNNKLPQDEYETKSGMGKFSIRKNSTDFQFINYAYEKSIKDYLLKHIDSFDVFIDAGACIGEYCIWLARLGKRCIAIEPVNFAALQKNISLNNLNDKIQAYNYGVGNVKEKVFFIIPDDVKSSSHIDRNEAREPNVEIETFDALSKNFNINVNDRIILKLDVEGMEVEAIQGATNFIQSHPNLRIIYEHFPEDGFRNDKALQVVADFNITDIDKVNRIASKTS